MSTNTVTARLGQHILVVLDSTPAFHDALRAAAAALPEVEQRAFTLLCCCPPRYWEHGGGQPDDVAQQVEQVEASRDRDFDRINRCLDHAAGLLREAGVPEARITRRFVTEHDHIRAAVMDELRQRPYSGVIVSAYHTDIINRLERRGLTDVFRSVPPVAVEVLETRAAAR
jgi:hypothetical protein